MPSSTRARLGWDCDLAQFGVGALFVGQHGIEQQLQLVAELARCSSQVEGHLLSTSFRSGRTM